MQMSLRYCCLRFSYKDSINMILKFAIEFFQKKKHKKNKIVYALTNSWSKIHEKNRITSFSNSNIWIVTSITLTRQIERTIDQKPVLTSSKCLRMFILVISKSSASSSSLNLLCPFLKDFKTAFSAEN